jgi:hypothetical protein
MDRRPKMPRFSCLVRRRKKPGDADARRALSIILPQPPVLGLPAGNSLPVEDLQPARTLLERPLQAFHSFACGPLVCVRAHGSLRSAGRLPPQSRCSVTPGCHLVAQMFLFSRHLRKPCNGVRNWDLGPAVALGNVLLAQPAIAYAPSSTASTLTAMPSVRNPSISMDRVMAACATS